MEWLERLNLSVDYIESHLEDEISLDKAAQIAACSPFHFQRMFSYIAGVPLSEYIRRRRMTAAAFALCNSDVKVLDLALRFGYESPTAFNRAFRSIHGISPVEARKKGAVLTSYSRISFRISIKGETEMKYKIETKEPFRIVGIKASFQMNLEESFTRVPQFWAENTQNGNVSKVVQLLNKEPFGLLGVSTCMNGSDFDYYIAVASDLPVGEGMQEYTVPGGTWAVFDCVGPMPTAMQELQTRIVSEWLPSSGCEYADAPDIEVYLDENVQSPDYRSQVWLPIVKKK